MDVNGGNGSMLVEKKDGSTEAFDRSKVLKSCTAAGCGPDQAEMIAGKIEEWCHGEMASGSIKTSAIREKVLEHMRMENPDAAGKYDTYTKPE